MIDRLKSLSVNKHTVEELLELRLYARGLRSEYELNKVPMPDWLTAAETDLDKEIKDRGRDDMKRRLSEAKSRRAAQMTLEEKRSATDKEIADLEAALQ